MKKAKLLKLNLVKIELLKKDKDTFTFRALVTKGCYIRSLINDIGNKCFSLPDSVAQIDEIQRQLSGFISGAVSDAVSKLNVDISPASKIDFPSCQTPKAWAAS